MSSRSASSRRSRAVLAFAATLAVLALVLPAVAGAAPTPLTSFDVATGAGDQKYPGVGRYGGTYFFAWTDETGTHLGDLVGRQAWGTPPDFWGDPPLDLATPYLLSDGTTYSNALGAVSGEYAVWSAQGGYGVGYSYDIWGRSWRGISVGGPATLPLFNVSDDEHTQQSPDFDVALKAGGIPSARWLTVWGDPRGDRTGYDIWGAVIDGTTGTPGPEFAVTRRTGSQWGCRVSGARVVWEDRRNYKNPDIWGATVNLTTRKVTVVKVKVAKGLQTFPDVFRKTVVYVQPVKGRGHIFKMTWGRPRSSRPIDRSSTIQTWPRIDGAWIVYQRRVSESDWDVWAYNTVTRKKLLVAGGPADQQLATVNGNVVVWQEATASGKDIKAAYLPWKAVVTANGKTRLYTRSLTPKLAVSARSNADKVRSYRLSYVYDRSSWTDWTSYDPTRATNAAGAYTLPDADGPYGVWAQFDDYSSNYSQLAYVDIFLDRKGPVTEATAPAAVVSGRTARLKYRVIDQAWTAQAKVTIRIRTKGGKLVKTLALGLRPAGETFTAPLNTAKFVCKLPKGAYTFTVYATDLAGNLQSVAGQNALTVN